MRVRLTWLLWLVAVGGADEATANWAEPVPGTLSVDASLQADAASIATIGSTPYVAWEEVDSAGRSLIRVKRLEASGWASVGGALNVSTSRDAYSPSLASVGDVPYVAWEEYDGSHFQIRVKRLEAGSWTAVGDSLNVSTARDASVASVAGVGSVPYVTWHEDDGTRTQIRVKRFDGSQWQAIGGPVNFSGTMPARFASVTDVGGVPYLAWEEADGTAQQIRVARLDGAGWTHLGDSLNVSGTQDASRPRITSVAGVPYVAWTEDAPPGSQVHVKRLDGATWTPVGSALNVATDDFTSSPYVAGLGSTAFVAWGEGIGDHAQLFAKRFDGNAWVPVGGTLNISTAFDASYPGVTTVGGVPYVSWDEYDSPTTRQIRVKRLEPDIVGESATPSLTGATLTAQIDDFGLPLPIAFEYGPTAAFGTATPLQTTTGAGASTVTQDVGGLTSGTVYSYRAFGSDGTRQTSLGTTQTFTTTAVAAPGVPVLTALKLTPATFRASKGTLVTYSDSVAATTTFTVQRPTVGRRKGGACVKARKRPPKAKRCTRYAKVRSLTHADVAGANRFRLKDRKLKPGAYRLRAVPRNSAGAGKAVTKRFRVKRR